MEYLLFRLYGPMASWGEIAVGESRHTASYPGKSALVGLLAAAFGIRRDEEERQAALSAGYRFAVKVISAGHPLRDYHTTQAPDSVGKFVYRTRRDELITGKERLGTILSSREYRCDSLSLVAVAAENSPPYPLGEIRDALLKPKFHLYLGRKSCPLAAPLNPVLQTADGFGGALDSYQFGALHVSKHEMGAAEREIKERGCRLREAQVLSRLSQRDAAVFTYGNYSVRYYWEGGPEELRPGEAIPIQTHIRHDNPFSRTRWQFSQRTEYLSLGKEEA